MTAGPAHYAGVMSGTSVDGVDAVVADFAPASGRTCEVLGFAHLPFAPSLRDALLALQASGPDEIARASDATIALADAYADAILAACADAKLPPADLAAAGVHGQTIRHRPERGWTVQLNDPARVAERAGVTIVADFRRRDVAAGGQGAPLVPVFHAALFAHPRFHRVIANLGGIANITDLEPGAPVRGFDTGPGNVLLDVWHARHRGGAYDEDGRWAASGRVDARLLSSMLDDPYFSLKPPKSTGRDRYHAAWIDERVGKRGDPAPADVQATLARLTARTLADAVRQHAPGSGEVLLAGGGARNTHLVRLIAEELAPRRVSTTAIYGIPVDQVEALAFAWLAREALAARPGNLPAVTGARGTRVLGAIYPR